MRWLALCTLKASCPIRISEFPFDKQTCSMTIGSWAFHGNAIQLSFYNNRPIAYTNYYKENTEWELVSMTAKQNLTKYDCCPIPFYDLTYTIHLHRKPLYYIMSVVIPCVLLSLLSTISFLFPAESGERICLITSTFLGMFVFMLIVNEKTPITSDVVPMISQYFTVIGFSTFMILLSTSFILWLHHPSTSGPVPSCLAQFARFFACLLCMGKPEPKTSGRIHLADALLADGKGFTYLNVGELLAHARNTTNVEKMLSEIQRFSRRIDEEDMKEELKKEWKYTANVFDRLFFLVSLLACIILNAYVLSFV